MSTLSRSVSLAVAAGLLAAAASAQAVTSLYWVGGSSGGVWDTTTPNWSTSSTGTPTTTWTNGNSSAGYDGANFPSTPTTVSVGANVNGYLQGIGGGLTLTGNGTNTLTLNSGIPAGSLLDVNGAAVVFAGGVRQGAADLQIDSGSATIPAGGTNFDPTTTNWSLVVNGGTLNDEGQYGFRLGSENFSGGTGPFTDASATQNGGTVTVVQPGTSSGEGLQIGTGSGTATPTAYTASYTENGGSLTVASLNIAAELNTTAAFNLAGGMVTVNTDTIAFGGTGDTIGTQAFNFVTGAGTPGTLVLKNTGISSTNPNGTAWNFSSLTGIKNSNFEVNGLAATSSELGFFSDPTLTGYTDITTAVPEPASLALIGIGVAGLILVKRRKIS